MSSECLILHGGALGDLALTLRLALRLPAVSAGSTLELVSRTNPGDLSGCEPRIRRVSSEGIGLHRLYSEESGSPPERLRRLAAGHPVLNALGSVESVTHRRLVMLGTHEVYSFDPRPTPGLETHITTQWQRDLERQGLEFSNSAGEAHAWKTLVVSEDLRERGRALFRRHGGFRESGRLHASEKCDSAAPPVATGSGGNGSTAGTGPGRYNDERGRTSGPRQPIVVHPGSGGRAKCWPLPCFLDVGRRLETAGCGVCFVAGPVEAERWPTEDLGTIRDEFPLIESPEPDDLAGLLAAARSLISNDAGPAHLAALVGTPTVTVFGPTSPSVWRPLGPRVRVVGGNPETDAHDWGIDPRQVVDAVLSA
jgi:hypothetical protein